MRLVLDSLIATMLVMLLAGVVWAHRTTRQVELAHEQVCDSLAKLHAQAVYHGALGDAELSATGFPQQVSPAWFGEQLPFNRFASARRPWIDVAPLGDDSDHPPDPVFNDDDLSQAGFWYNPARGVFRARVPQRTTDAETLALYNDINDSAMASLPLALDEARQPIAHAPLPATTSRTAEAQSAPVEPAEKPVVKRPTLRAD